MLPENYYYYIDDFTYPSVDEFKAKIFEKGIDALFEYNHDYKEAAAPHDSKRRDNIRNVLDNCVYEVFYKGEKAEIVELIGFNVHLGTESRSDGGIGAVSYCEYFIKFDDGDPGVAFVRFYDYSRMSEGWDSFEKKTIGNNLEILYSKQKIVYNGKETECIINGTRDTKNGEWLYCDGFDLYLKHNDNVVVLIDFAPWDEINAFVERSNNSIQMQKKIKEELMVSSSLPFNKSGFLDNLDDYFTFKKVYLQMGKD